MGTQKGGTEQKLKGKGFGLRLTSAILIALFAVGLIIGNIIVFRSSYSSSFMGWFDLGFPWL